MTNDLIVLQPITIATESNPARAYLASLGKRSQRVVKMALANITEIVRGNDAAGFESLPWHELRNDHMQAIRARLAERYSAATANLHLAALKGVLKAAWRQGLMTTDEYTRAIDVKPVRGETLSQAEKGRHLTQGELTALVNSCLDNTKAGARDLAIIAVGYACGLRRAEIAMLDLADYNSGDQTLLVRFGKGNKQRSIPIAGSTIDALHDWIFLRGIQPGPLFLRIRRGDHLQASGLTDQAIYAILQSRAKQAGVKAFSPHDLRRTFAGDLLDAGADIVTVQKLMGHSDVSTTADYDRRDATAKHRAVSHLHVPYTRRFK